MACKRNMEPENIGNARDSYSDQRVQDAGEDYRGPHSKDL